MKQITLKTNWLHYRKFNTESSKKNKRILQQKSNLRQMTLLLNIKLSILSLQRKWRMLLLSGKTLADFLAYELIQRSRSKVNQYIQSKQTVVQKTQNTRVRPVLGAPKSRLLFEINHQVLVTLQIKASFINTFKIQFGYAFQNENKIK